MPRVQVYVETTIPSFYHTTRPGPEALARRAWTQRWWAAGCERYTLVTSDLANANKFGHIRRVNSLLGLYVPVLATPLELLGESHEPGT